MNCTTWAPHDDFTYLLYLGEPAVTGPCSFQRRSGPAPECRSYYSVLSNLHCAIGQIRMSEVTDILLRRWYTVRVDDLTEPDQQARHLFKPDATVHPHGLHATIVAR